MSQVIIDFSKVGRRPEGALLRDFDPECELEEEVPVEPEDFGMRTSVAQRMKEREEARMREANEQAVLGVMRGPGVDLPAAKLEAMKATFVASGGNLSEVARTHDVSPDKVMKLAQAYDWPVYGAGYSSAEKSRKTRLENLAVLLEQQVFDLASSLAVEKKELDELNEKGLNSRFVASLSQRSQAFSTVFDRYMRVMTLLEPETFGADDNAVAARVRAEASPDALGGVDGVNRMLADFAARVSVGVVKGLQERNEEVVRADVIDVDPVD